MAFPSTDRRNLRPRKTSWRVSPLMAGRRCGSTAMIRRRSRRHCKRRSRPIVRCWWPAARSSAMARRTRPAPPPATALPLGPRRRPPPRNAWAGRRRRSRFRNPFWPHGGRPEHVARRFMRTGRRALRPCRKTGGRIFCVVRSAHCRPIGARRSPRSRTGWRPSDRRWRLARHQDLRSMPWRLSCPSLSAARRT